MLIGITSNISSCSGHSKSNTSTNVLPTTSLLCSSYVFRNSKMPLEVFWFYNKADF